MSSVNGLVSSNRRLTRPPNSSAIPKFRQTDLACPMCMNPFGSGGKRVATGRPKRLVATSCATISRMKSRRDAGAGGGEPEDAGGEAVDTDRNPKKACPKLIPLRPVVRSTDGHCAPQYLRWVISRPLLTSTPCHARTAPLVRAQTWRRWAGFQIASAYEPHPDREYAAVRNAAALFDVSPLYKYLIAGPDAARLLDRMVTRDVTTCRIGQVLYTPWCDAHGKVIDDGTISRLDESTFRLTSAEPNLRWLAMNAVGLDVRIDDMSERTAALALQGPLAGAILQQLSPDLGALRYFRLART